MVNLPMVFVLAAMLLTAGVASALYVSSVSAQMSNSTSTKNMTNATMAGNMTKKMTNMTAGPFKQLIRQSKNSDLLRASNAIRFFFSRKL